MAKEITSSEDIQLMVNEFYGKVKEDELLGPIFESVVKGNWDAHLEKMHGFWETIIFNVKKYTGSPFQKHVPLPIDAKHFERWLALFHETIDQHFKGKNAEEIKKRSTQMGLMFECKLKHIKGGE
tara:strand:+ start:23981 stop:24355 length:375 start_codon:yes stop_codon:yes gene_type:complete